MLPLASRTLRASRRAVLVPVVVLLCGLAVGPSVQAQDRSSIPPFLLDPAYRSNRSFEKKGVMDGNEVAITITNNGLLAGVGEVRGNWPKGSEDFYVGDVLPVVAMEVPVDLNGDARPDTLVQSILTTRGPGNRGIPGPPGNSSVAWTMEPVPGFASDRVRQDTGERNDKLAFSTDPETWPDFWPDQPTWIDPATGRVQWNGFFGRNQFNADLETYFWTDDVNYTKINDNFPSFRADTTQPDRRGLGIAMKVRGLQWSQFLAQDAIFWLYEITNTSTTTYPRVAVGLTVGTAAGGDGDTADDLAFFDQANRIVYSWDFDNSGNQRQPVGYVGYGFLESPGNDDNAIDDDGDGDPFTSQGLDIEGRPYVPLDLAGTDNVFTSADFEARILQAGDPLVLIDASTGARSIVYLGTTEIDVVSQGITYRVGPGSILEETQVELPSRTGVLQIVTDKNLIDEDLDGLIDEDEDLHFTRRAQSFTGEIITLPALRYKNYVGFGRAIQGREATRADSVRYGLLNPMIDESRDDGIDNDGDWSLQEHDTGADGLAGTGDAGEGDGVPSPGEPFFDATDVSESDQVGLTSFYYFAPSGAFPLSREGSVWDGMAPGFFTTNEELSAQQSAGGIDGDFVFGSGYFSLEPGETLRFTLALVFGNDLQDITNNTVTIQEIYNRNYQFARPPARPRLQAVPGDGKVTLYWDNQAEFSEDPILGQDFEGYRLYRSTDPFFRDPEVVTDVQGNSALLKPLAQYDVSNGINGVWPNLGLPNYAGAQTAADSLEILTAYIQEVEQSQALLQRTRGTPFFLGEDTGLRYTYVDSLVNNGQRYYYALTAYDRGSPSFYPAENNFAITVAEDGTVITGENVVEVIPNAPVGGYQVGSVLNGVAQTAGAATGSIDVEILDPRRLQDDKAYEITFQGTGAEASTFTVRSGGQALVENVPLASSTSGVFDGMRLRLNNATTQIDTFYNQNPGSKISLRASPISIATWNYNGRVVPYDYELRFANEPVGQSLGGFRLGTTATAPTAVARTTNFTVYNTTLGRNAEFVVFEAPATNNGILDAVGESVFIYETIEGQRVPTYGIVAQRFADQTVGVPAGAGDVFVVETEKAFTASDRFAFTTRASTVDPEAAKAQMERIRVVPNPYVAAASWERDLPQTITSGRGERRIDFINLPANARIRIYNVRGALVRELHHDSGIDDGSVPWDLRTREGLEVAYGVYFYHVEAPGVGERTGRLALIK